MMLATVMLLACLNVATLLLARSEARKVEIATRLAIGAGRWRVVRQLMTESLVIAVISGVLGLALSWWASLYPPPDRAGVRWDAADRPVTRCARHRVCDSHERRDLSAVRADAGAAGNGGHATFRRPCAARTAHAMARTRPRWGAGRSIAGARRVRGALRSNPAEPLDTGSGLRPDQRRDVLDRCRSLRQTRAGAHADVSVGARRRGRDARCHERQRVGRGAGQHELLFRDPRDTGRGDGVSRRPAPGDRVQPHGARLLRDPAYSAARRAGLRRARPHRLAGRRDCQRAVSRQIRWGSDRAAARHRRRRVRRDRRRQRHAIREHQGRTERCRIFRDAAITRHRICANRCGPLRGIRLRRGPFGPRSCDKRSRGS